MLYVISYFTDFNKTIDGNSLHRGFYFGGITGAAFGGNEALSNKDASQITDDDKKVVIKNCISYTSYSDTELKGLINPSDDDDDSINETKRRLRSNFVGGVVGGCRYAFIENCSTTPEENNGKYSFVFGDRYVGGVVGYSFESFYSGDEDYNSNELKKITGRSTEEAETLGYRSN